MEHTNLKIVPFPKEYNRFCIMDENNKIVDDAQGYGYKTIQNANKALWYKFKNGRNILDKEKNEALKFFKDNPEIKKSLNDILEINFKEICRGETTDEEILKCVEEEFKVKLPKNIIKYL
jgi:hypothetical protein